MTDQKNETVTFIKVGNGLKNLPKENQFVFVKLQGRSPIFLAEIKNHPITNELVWRGLEDRWKDRVNGEDEWYPAQTAGTDPFTSYLERQWKWSRETFGPHPRTRGVLDHIRKECAEAEANPHDLEEWADIITLALDGFQRHGGTVDQLLPILQAKQDKNFARTWPDWREMPEDRAIEHISEGAPVKVRQVGPTYRVTCPCCNWESVFLHEPKGKILCPACKHVFEAKPSTEEWRTVSKDGLPAFEKDVVFRRPWHDHKAEEITGFLLPTMDDEDGDIAEEDAFLDDLEWEAADGRSFRISLSDEWRYRKEGE